MSSLVAWSRSQSGLGLVVLFQANGSAKFLKALRKWYVYVHGCVDSGDLLSWSVGERTECTSGHLGDSLDKDIFRVCQGTGGCLGSG